MRLSARIRLLQTTEVVDVVDKLAAAKLALEEADEQQQAYFGKNTKKNDWLGAKKNETPDKREEIASWNLKEVRWAFDPMVGALQAWLDHGSSTFFPAVIAWDEGDDSLAESLPELVETRQRLAAAFEKTLPPLRSQVLVVAPIRTALHRLSAAVDAQQRVEDVEVVPALLSGQRTTTNQATGRRAERYKTSDDVARSLRMSRPADLAREPKEPEPTGLFASIKKLFGG